MSAPLPHFTVVHDTEANRRIFTAKLTCCKCRSTIGIPMNTSGQASPEFLAKKADEKGWKLKGRKWICPKIHVKPKPEEAAMPAAKKDAASNVKPIRDLNPKEVRAVIAKLDAHFDDERGRYLDGYSDKRIAEDCNVPPMCVTRYRDEAFGPLKRDPALDEALTELAKMEAALADVRSRADRIHAEVGRIGEEVDAVMKRIEALD